MLTVKAMTREEKAVRRERRKSDLEILAGRQKVGRMKRQEAAAEAMAAHVQVNLKKMSPADYKKWKSQGFKILRMGSS